MNDFAINNYYGISMYALNEVAKSIKGGKFVDVDNENKLVLYYKPMDDLWLTHKMGIDENGKLIDIDTSEDGSYWSIPKQFIKTCNTLFTFKENKKDEYKTTDDSILLVYFFHHMYDGKFGEEYKTSDKCLYWYEIKNDKVIRYKQKRRNIKFVGYEFEDILQDPQIVEQWTTQEEILTFLRNNGWMLSDDKVIECSIKHISWRINND